VIQPLKFRCDLSIFKEMTPAWTGRQDRLLQEIQEAAYA